MLKRIFLLYLSELSKPKSISIQSYSCASFFSRIIKTPIDYYIDISLVLSQNEKYL